MLAHKRIAYRTVELPFAIHPPIVRSLGFDDDTVPALKIDGRRIQNTRTIARELDRLRPHPRLFPEDADERRHVEEAERWGEQVFQSVPRRIAWWVLIRDRGGFRRVVAQLEMPLWMRLAARPSSPLLLRLAYRRNRVTSDKVRADLAALPSYLDRIDGWIEDGVLDGRELNAADFQIASSVRMLLAIADVAPFLQSRAVARHARRVVPAYPEGAGAGLIPRSWLP